MGFGEVSFGERSLGRAGKPGHGVAGADSSIWRLPTSTQSPIGRLHDRIGLVVIGPDAAVAAGLADALRERNVPVFGPSRAAAELEWSKSFAKSFMSRHGIPTADYAVFDRAVDALAHVEAALYPLVLKADGLAAGKGVLICATRARPKRRFARS